jgi:hypothetical protein
MRYSAALVAVLTLVTAADAVAHPAPFSYLDLHLSDTGIEGSLIVHDFDVAHDLGVDPPERFRDQTFAARYRDQLRRLLRSRMMLTVDGQPAEITWTGFEALPDRQSLRLSFRSPSKRPGRLQVDAILFPYDPVHQTFINVYEDGELHHQTIVDRNRSTADYYAGSWQGAAAVLAVFIPAGIEHIVVGPDHVLFLVGLMLLGGSLWRLATIVTAFTLGHSITLSLAALDVVSPPASVVEPVIALSIVFVGADNLLVQRDRRKATHLNEGATAPRDIRAWVAGVFGLVHGFGFASVLKEFGLPLTALGWSLFSFNLGVEVGQLAIVVAVAAVLRAVHRRNPVVGWQLAVAGSVIVIAAGSYWFVERVFLTGGS